MSVKHSVQKFVREVLSSFKKKSSHKGIQKVRIPQNMLIPRRFWPILIYKILNSVFNHLENKMSSYLRKCINTHQSTSNICLHSSSFPCPPSARSQTLFWPEELHVLFQSDKDLTYAKLLLIAYYIVITYCLKHVLKSYTYEPIYLERKFYDISVISNRYSITCKIFSFDAMSGHFVIMWSVRV